MHFYKRNVLIAQFPTPCRTVRYLLGIVVNDAGVKKVKTVLS